MCKTEGDLLDWLAGQVDDVPTYDPAKHITAEDFAAARGMSVSWARRQLEKLCKAGKMRRVDIMHYPSGRRGAAYERLG